MSYWETLLVIMRRWRISVPAMLAALGVGIGAYFVAPPSYEDSAQVLFLGSPIQPGQKALTNPYLDLGSTLVSTADVIRLKVSTPQVGLTLAGQGATAEYAVALDQSTPAPVLIVTTKNTKPAVARETTLAVVKEIQTILEQLQEQAGAPRSTWVATSVISSLPQPARKLNASLRPAIVASGGIFALTMFVLFLPEGRQRRRETDQRPAPRRPVATGPAPNDPFGIPYAGRSEAQLQRGSELAAPAVSYAPTVSYAPRPISHPLPAAQPQPSPQPISRAQRRAQPTGPAPQPVANGSAPERPAPPQSAPPAAPAGPSAYPAPTTPQTRQVPRLLPTHTPHSGQASRPSPQPGRLLGEPERPAQTWLAGEFDGESNGHQNGHANGHANGNGNGNGRANGHARGDDPQDDASPAKPRTATTGPEAEGRTTWRR